MNKEESFMASLSENLGFLIGAAIIIAGIFAIASISEHLIQKKVGITEKIQTTRRIALIGMFSGISIILMLFEIPLPFAPGFYKIDISEVPILVCAFALGPVAGIAAEFVKIILNLFVTGTTTAFVGEFANFIIGCSFVLPAAIIYRASKTRKSAIIGVVAGTLSMTVIGSSLNAFYLLPFYAKLFEMDLSVLIGMGTKINAGIDSVTTFVLYSVVPFNLLKGVIVSFITVLIYKKIRIILK